MKNKNRARIKIGEIEAAPGRSSRGYVKLGERTDHQDFHIPVIIINGKREGPVVYIQAASDGNELNGVAVLHRIIRMLDPEDLAGSVIAVPTVNIHALNARQAVSPVDNKKMNRCFPGKRKGSSSERIASFLFNNAVVHADYCIDLHQRHVDPMIDKCVVRVTARERAGRASLEMARVFGIGYILHEKGYEGQLARSAPKIGIPTIDPELGGSRGWDDVSVQKGIRGVLNVLKHYGLIKGKPEIPGRQIVARAVKPVFADSGGFLLLEKKLYERVKKGEAVAKILDPFGDTVEEIASPAEGILWAHTPHPVAVTGEHVVSVGTSLRYI